MGPRYAGAMDINETNSSLRRGVKGVLCCRMASFPQAADGVFPGPLLPVSPQRPQRLKARNWPHFHGVVRGLRGLLPAAFPIIVRSARLPSDTLGCCHRTDERFVIRLADRLSQPEAVEVLLHEWAHALSWNHSLDKLAEAPDLDRDAFEDASHDGAWGLAYAKTWRLYSGVLVPGLGG